MQNIEKDIKKNEYKPVYLLYGEEAYLKRAYKNKMKNAIVGDESSMNYNSFEGKSVDVKEIIEFANTLPFLAEYRLLIIENSGYFKNANQEMADFIEEIPESTVIVFVEEEVDKRGRLFKAVKSFGYFTELSRQTDNKLIAWVLGILTREKKKITEANMHLLLSKTGNDMENIEKEVDKLISYTLGRDIITAEDIEAICSTQVTGKIFQMIDAISGNNQKEALNLYYDLLTLKEPPLRILFLIARQFNLLLQVKWLSNQGMGNDAIAKQIGLQSFLIGKYFAQARRFQTEFLKSAVEECVETEEAIKTGRLEDQLGVELLIVKYSRK
ncbi:MAG: DNA polymerase III subunit delta [Clostridiales bacterium]|nr:DNA polymerase III subunit delta [Clostridiales bacterium]